MGLAQIWIETEEDGQKHITKGKVTLNTTILAGDSRFDPAAAQHVLCQEIGHILGLDHDRTAWDTCMDDGGSATTATEWFAILNDPNKTTSGTHDGQQLTTIYSHSDSSGVTPSAEDEKGGPPCSKKNKPGCDPNKSGRWVTVHVFAIPSD